MSHGSSHGLRTPREEIAFTARPKIQSQSQIFRYGQSIFCLPHRPNFSDIFDLCLHLVFVVRGQIYLNRVKNIWTLSKKIWTSRWIRHWWRRKMHVLCLCHFWSILRSPHYPSIATSVCSSDVKILWCKCLFEFCLLHGPQTKGPQEEERLGWEPG